MSKEKDRKKLAKTILEAVGGAGNVSKASHCYTRLRMTINDTAKLDDEEIKAIPGVLGLVKRGSDYQIVIGPDVSSVYLQFASLGDFEGSEAAPKETKKKNFLLVVLDFLAGTFSPVIPVLIAGGLTGAVLTILTSFFGVTADSGTYKVFEAVQRSAFYFLPVFVGYSAAKQLNINAFLGGFMGTILVYSTIDGAEGLSFLGLNIHQTVYNTTVFPVLLAVVFMSFLYKGLDNVLPKVIKTVFLPLITMLVSVPVVLLVLGPIGDIIGSYISDGIYAIYNIAPPLAVLIIGAATPFLVFFGMNNALYPIVFALFAAQSSDPLIIAGMLAANISIGAASLAVGMKFKEEKVRSVGISTGVTGLLGITEPAVYGVLFPMKKPLIAAVAGGAVGGLLCGILRVAGYAIASPSMATLVTFIPGDGTMYNFYAAIGVAVVSFLVAFVTSWLINVEESVA